MRQTGLALDLKILALQSVTPDNGVSAIKMTSGVILDGW